ncbi:TrkA family potassium uptake protein [Schaalia sp. 19OD2882]|uniref:potassium channel family protein n=1 Tax=Schaalia sp. 19OD2882 TaxID=2794089 RepID=UPI001C1E9C2C|nr:TrkA family potassium uptake protein [Schaalia sp. 19OD2882]QWW20436.1 TrkA family potassium uptake protein [Schaalia sp. 19OD2882]
MKIVIAGAGAVGRTVALELIDHGHDVTLIDHQPDQIRVSSVAEADWVLADACSPDALREAGVGDADVLVATTGDDKANLVISLLAKTEFSVPRVVARLTNPKNEWLFDASWGVDVLVSTSRIVTALVEEAISEGLPVRLFSFNNSDVSMYALTLPEGSALSGQAAGRIQWPARVALTALLRDGRPITPGADDLLESGDELVLLVPDTDRAVLGELARMVEVRPRGEDEGTGDLDAAW